MRGVPADGTRIRQIRRSRGTTQEALAAAADCDVKTIRSAERGSNLDVATLKRLAAALDVEFSVITIPPGPSCLDRDDHPSDVNSGWFQQLQQRLPRARHVAVAGLAAAVLLLVGSAYVINDSTGTRRRSRRALENANLAVIERHLAAINARDPEAYAETYHDHALWVLTPTSFTPMQSAVGEQSFHGAAEIRRKIQGNFDATTMEELSRDNVTITASDDRVIVRGIGIRVKGVASGREIQMMFVNDYQLKDAKIIHHFSVYDTAAWQSLFD